MRTLTLPLLWAVAAAGTAPSLACAWGFEGHEIIADIARARLTPAVLAEVDALLASDADNTLTAHDMAAEATWADAWRGAGHRETAQWHFVDQELAHPDLTAACFGRPALDGTPASAGPAQDCVVDKIAEFTAELGAASTPQERLLALKYLLHFIGDVHQPLHASNNQDRGGNCVQIALGGPRTVNLHSFWDTGALAPLGSNPRSAATTLNARISPAQAQAWARGSAADWARESYDVAQSVAYTLGLQPGCDESRAPIPLPAGYADRALAAAELQLEKAGVRLAFVLNTALA